MLRVIHRRVGRVVIFFVVERRIRVADAGRQAVLVHQQVGEQLVVPDGRLGVLHVDLEGRAGFVAVGVAQGVVELLLELLGRAADLRIDQQEIRVVAGVVPWPLLIGFSSMRSNGSRLSMSSVTTPSLLPRIWPEPTGTPLL